MNRSTPATTIKPRILTAVVLVPLVLAGIFWLPPAGLLALGVALAVVGGLEWAELIHIPRGGRLVYALVVGGGTWLAAHLPALGVALAAGVWWLLVLAEVPLFRPQSDEPVFRAAHGLAGLLTLAPAFGLLVGLVAANPWHAVALLVFIWAADIGAYFVGKAWGRHGMVPNVSPGKTWEGLIGGMALAAGAAGAFAWARPELGAPIVLIGLALLVAVVGQLGDLSESMFKRRANVKDSGRWLPGHGGILDRVDSLTAAVPVYIICLWGVGL